MLLREDTAAIQRDFAKYCREGKGSVNGLAHPERLRHYRRLVFNVVYGIFEKAFPISRSILTNEEFINLSAAFLSRHDAHSNQVWQLPGEFSDFVTALSHDEIQGRLFLSDLLRMEWTEILVYNRAEKTMPGYLPHKPGGEDIAAFNPDFEILELDYPVFGGGWETILQRKGKYFLLIFRNTVSHKVHYIELSKLNTFLLQEMLQGMSLDRAIVRAGEKIPKGELPSVNDLLPFIDALYERAFILGVRK